MLDASEHGGGLAVLELSGMKKLDASVIIVSREKDNVGRVEKSLTRKFEGFEVIAVYGAGSMFSGWRRGVAKAKKKYLMFCHDDVEFLDIPCLDYEMDKETGLIGLAGSREIDVDNSWWYDPKRLVEGKLSGQIFRRGSDDIYVSYFGYYSEVVVVDGVCMVTTKKKLAQVGGIPKIRWARWHYYDHVLALSFRNKLKLKTIPIQLIHDSRGAEESEVAEAEKVKERFGEWMRKMHGERVVSV